MPVDLDKDTQKAVVKEAISEWLDAQFAQFGIWSIKGIAACALAGLLYAYLTTHGFKL